MASTYLLKPPPGDPTAIERWQRLSRSAGYSDFATFLRDAIEKGLAGVADDEFLPAPLLKVPAVVPRTGVCGETGVDRALCLGPCCKGAA